MAQAPANQKRVAVVIGNAGYEHAAPLRNTLGDASAIAAKLREVGFSELTLHENLDFEAMRRVLRQFARAAEGADMAVVYYAGHGIEADGENYLIPIDAALEHDRDIGFETVPLGQVIRALDGPGALRLAILDACRDNPFRTGMLRTGGRTRSLGRGLADVEPSGNVLVAFAAKGGTVALDGAGLNSPFAAALIEHLGKPGLEVGFLFRHVRDAVLKATSQQQEPHLYGSLGAAPIYFVAADEATPAATPASGADIFISYASVDRDLALEMAQSLQADGYRVWWDTKLLGGEQFRKVIIAEIDAARAAIVIWTTASVESDWVYEEARRARDTRKLIPVRVKDLDPRDIQPPFGALHTLLIDDRAGLRAALARLNVLAAPRADRNERPAPGPVDDRTVEHSYWIAVQDSKDPTDFETFVEKFPAGVYTPLARRRVESLLGEASAELIARFLQEHPESAHAERARARAVAIEWAQVAPLNSADKLRGFIARYDGSPEAGSATAMLAKLEWVRLNASEDIAEIERFAGEFRDAPEAAIAWRRLDMMRREAAAWRAAETAGDAVSLQQYLREFPRGRRAAEARAKLRSLGSTIPSFSISMPKIDLKTLPYGTIAIVGAGLGLLARVFFGAGLSGISVHEVSYGDGKFYFWVALLDPVRIFFVGAFLLLVIRLTQAPKILRLIGLLLGLYAFETAVEILGLELSVTSNVPYVLLRIAAMPIEWLFVAVLFFTLQDKIMMAVAAVAGLAFGVADAIIWQFPYPVSGYLDRSLAFAYTGVCIAYGIRRQQRIAAGASPGSFWYA
jgi:hypothetical protein